MDDLILRLAAHQGGVLTTAQARALGWDRRTLRGAVKGGLLDHLGRGLYAVSSATARTPEERHRTLCRGGLLLYPDAIISRASALLVHELPVYQVDLSRAWLSRPVSSEVNTQSFVIRPMTDARSCTTNGSTAVRAAEAIVQATMDHGVVTGVVAADKALHDKLISLDELARVADRVRAGRIRRG